MLPSIYRRVPALLFGLAATPLAAQDPLEPLVTRLAAMTAVSGYEHAVTDTLLTLLPGAERDRAGSVLLTLGSGEPRRLIACGLDEPGFVIGNIRADGYLTLRRVGPNPQPLFDQQLEGQRITVWGRKGAVPGVVGIHSVHLTRGRSASEAPFTFDSAFVDIGARSAAEARALGVEVLAPLALEKRPHRYADSLLAGPAVTRRAACAALLEAAQAATPARGTVIIAFVGEQLFTQRGLLTVARNLGPFTTTILLDRGATRDVITERQSPDPRYLGKVETWLLPSRYPGSAVETVSFPDVAALRQSLTLRIRGSE